METTHARLMTRRWGIALAAVLIQLCLGTVYAWSIFKKPMMAANGWGETQTQVAFMIYGAVFALAVAFGGTLVDRVGPRIIGTLGGALYCAGILLGGLANGLQSITLLITAYGFIAGLGGGFGYVTPIATLIRWFPDKRGMLTGLAVMGYGLGSFIMGNLGPALIIDFGVAHTFYLWGVVCLAVILPSALFLSNPPGDWAPSPCPQGSPHAASLPESSTFAQAVRSPRFWILWTMLFVSITAGLGLISQLSPMAQEVMLAALAASAPEETMREIAIASGTVVAIAGLFNGFGRLAWSWFSDFIGRRAVFALIFLSFAAGFALLTRVHTLFVFSGLCFYLLACYGGTMASMPALAADEFGSAHIGKIYGVIFTACGLASFCGPYIFATAKELTGGFTCALFAEAGLAVLGLVLTGFLHKVERRNN
jgi:OFA family oxalate/formate antiporter-like MFS transporter